LKFHFQQALRALILLAFTGLIFKMHITGEITKFINPKYVGLSQTASVIFLVLFFIQITRIWSDKHKDHNDCHHNHEGTECGHDHDHGDTPFSLRKLFSYAIIVFPLLTGFLLPPKVLDASIAEKKGGMAIFTNPKQNKAEGSDTGQNTSDLRESPESTIEDPTITGEHSFIDDNAVPETGIENMMSKKEYEELIQKLNGNSTIVMDDLVFAAYYEEISADIQKYRGRQIELTGFVYKEDVLQENQLVLSRFLITHCVADASIIGFISELEEAPSIDQDTWIKATGIIDTTSFDGVELPMVKITGWEKVEEPLEPYLYPIMVKVL
jgi:putative membrane protein